MTTNLNLSVTGKIEENKNAAVTENKWLKH